MMIEEKEEMDMPVIVIVSDKITGRVIQCIRCDTAKDANWTIRFFRLSGYRTQTIKYDKIVEWIEWIMND